ncbi:hypothetical protein GJ496_001821 [Pomphorhynchus laevis]|nr:hypothetical protein GJ496_001821 [Pomphorhynchus laevis]
MGFRVSFVGMPGVYGSIFLGFNEYVFNSGCKCGERAVLVLYVAVKPGFGVDNPGLFNTTGAFKELAMRDETVLNERCRFSSFTNASICMYHYLETTVPELFGTVVPYNSIDRIVWTFNLNIYPEARVELPAHK